MNQNCEKCIQQKSLEKIIGWDEAAVDECLSEMVMKPSAKFNSSQHKTNMIIKFIGLITQVQGLYNFALGSAHPAMDCG